MDHDDDGLVSARGLSVSLGLSARGEASRRLRALYCAHAPPLLARQDLAPTTFTDTGEEVADDAIAFFDGIDNPSTPEPLEAHFQRSMSDVYSDQMDKSSDSTTSQSGSYPRDGQSADLVRRCALGGLGASLPGSPATPSAPAPALPRAHFLQLLAAMHALTHHDPDLYEAVVVAGTVLLQLGEMSQRPDLGREISQDSLCLAAAAAVDTADQLDPNGNAPAPVQEKAQPSPSPSKESDQAENTWFITLEQFLATILAQPALEKFFNQNISLQPQLEALRQRDRLHSVS